MIKLAILIVSIFVIVGLVFGAHFLARRGYKKSSTEAVLAELMPGINCKECGRKTCALFAKDLAKDKTNLDNCPYLNKTSFKKAKNIIERNRKIKFDKVALVRCKGGIDCTNKFEYIGDNTCKSKNLFHSGDKQCPFACLGCGDCAKVCPYDAIFISDKGCAVVDKSKCTGCGECVKTCPNELISIVDSDQFVEAICKNSSTDTVITRNCKVSCTHCDACVASCPTNAITIVGGLPKIDKKKCIKCGKCVSACPNHVISRI